MCPQVSAGLWHEGGSWGCRAGTRWLCLSLALGWAGWQVWALREVSSTPRCGLAGFADECSCFGVGQPCLPVELVSGWHCGQVGRLGFALSQLRTLWVLCKVGIAQMSSKRQTPWASSAGAPPVQGCLVGRGSCLLLWGVSGWD